MRPAICLFMLALWPLRVSAQRNDDSLARKRVVGPAGERVQNLLRRYASYGFSGAVLVALNGTVILLDAYGLADRDRDIENTPATMFEMNSMAKTLTGAAILQLEEQGRLRSTDLVARYLGPFPTLKSPVTIEHLATHTSGLVAAGAPLAGNSRDAFVQSVKDAPIESRPGNRYRYTNAGFSLLAAIVEEVTGQTYDDYVRQHLFGPAGLRSSSFRGEVPPDNPLLARGYVGSPAGAHASQPSPYDWGTIGAGGWVATVGDVYRWVLALESGAMISPQSRKKLFLERPNRREGYGWHVERTGWGTTLIDKGGGSNQFASQILWFPDDHLIVVWASNDLRQVWRRTLNLAVPAAALGREAPLPPPVARGHVDVAPLTGGYGVDQEVVYLRAGEGYLYARRNKAGLPDDVMFFPQTPTSFTAFDPASLELMSLRFARSPSGELSAEFQRGKNSLRLQRLP